MNFFAEVGKHVSSLTQDVRIVSRHLKGLAGERNALPAICLQFRGPAANVDVLMARCRLYQSGTVARVARGRLLQALERLEDSISLPGVAESKCAQVQVVCGDVVGRAAGRPTDLCRLQCWLDNAGGPVRHLAPELEN